jgi:hypothetical protein
VQDVAQAVPQLPAQPPPQPPVHDWPQPLQQATAVLLLIKVNNCTPRNAAPAPAIQDPAFLIA